jgi:hypothetical protein
VAAAPLLFDDPPIASPELALVDADLAAHLRAELPTGEAFRPRDVPRVEYPTLVFDAVVRDLDQDEDVADEAQEPSADDSGELPEYVVYVVPHSEDVVESSDAETTEHATAESPEPPLLEVLPAPEVQSFALPDYIVVSDDDVVDELPDYVVLPEEEAAPVMVAADETAPALPAYVVPEAEESAAEDVVVAATTDQSSSRSDYPVLPDLDERSDALEETEAALRRIREQMVTPSESKPRRRLRRRFTVFAGLGVVGALAVYAADVQLGVLQAPGFLAF